MPAQEGKLGQFWLIGSAVILTVMGIACMASSLGASTLPVDAIESVCPALLKAGPCMEDACLTACDNDPALSGALTDECRKECKSGTMDEAKMKLEVEKCNVDIYKGNQCICSDDANADSCDCAGTELQNFIDLWGLLCLAFGLLGVLGAIVFTALPAAVSAWKPVPCCNYVFFSVCSGIWSLVFLGIGAGFIMIGAAFAPGGPIRTALLEGSGCDESWSSEVDGGDATSAAIAGAVDCLQESVCGAVLSLADKVTAAATSIGVPYFLAGLVMFAGCYVCCWYVTRLRFEPVLSPAEPLRLTNSGLEQQLQEVGAAEGRKRCGADARPKSRSSCCACCGCCPCYDACCRWSVPGAGLMYDWLTVKPRHRGLTSRFSLTTFTSKLKPPAPYRKDVEHELICVGVLVSVCLATKAGSAFKHPAKPPESSIWALCDCRYAEEDMQPTVDTIVWWWAGVRVLPGFLSEIYIKMKIWKGREEVTMLEATANDDDDCCCLQTDKRRPHSVDWETKASERKGRAAQQLAGTRASVHLLEGCWSQLEARCWR